MPTKQGIPFDPEIVFRVTAGDTFEVVVDESSVVTFNFARATFEPAAFSAAGGTPEKAAPLAGKPQGKTAAPPAAKPPPNHADRRQDPCEAVRRHKQKEEVKWSTRPLMT